MLGWRYTWYRAKKRGERYGDAKNIDQSSREGRSRMRITMRASRAWCALACLAAGELRAQAPERDPGADRIVALVERLGGQIERNLQAPGQPVVGIRLATTRVTDNELGTLRSLSTLRSLDLAQTRISDAGLALLRGHEGLRSLVLFDTYVTDRGCASIATLKGLEALAIGSCDVRGPGLAQLESLDQLRTLSIVMLEVDDDDLVLLERLNRLEQLELVALKIDDRGLEHLRGLARLKRLKLDRNPITDAGLTHLAGLTELQELGLQGTRVTEQGLVALKSLPKLKRVRHGGTGSIAPVSGERPRSGATDEPAAAASPTVAVADLTPARIKAAARRALVPLQKTLTAYTEKRDCFSCHNQGVPLIALKIARSRGLAIDEDAFQDVVAQTLADLEGALDRYRQGRGQPGGADRASYALWALEAGDHPPDQVTGAVADFLLKTDRERDHWTAAAERVPIEGSHFTVTALSLRELQYYGAGQSADVIKERVARARSWLTGSKPRDTEDRVFRLWGLKYAGGSPEEIEAAAKDLLATQRGDGGWSQTDRLASDSYATGSALVALHQAGGLATDDPAYRRGLAFLIGSQKDDGTWFVASRSNPFQLYFESGFPYGKNQFIAVAASAWAAAALALALPPGP
jgi:hypothetical protein